MVTFGLGIVIPLNSNRKKQYLKERNLEKKAKPQVTHLQYMKQNLDSTKIALVRLISGIKIDTGKELKQ